MPDMSMFTEQEMRTIQLALYSSMAKIQASVLSWKSHQESAWLFADDWRPFEHNLGEDKSTEKDGENPA